MKQNKQNTDFWTVLATVNALALMYPFNLLHRADTADETLFAAFALVGLVFLLMVVDAVSIVVMGLIGNNNF